MADDGGYKAIADNGGRVGRCLSDGALLPEISNEGGESR